MLLSSFLGAVSLLTRLPVPSTWLQGNKDKQGNQDKQKNKDKLDNKDSEEQDMGTWPAYFPLVGLFLGLVFLGSTLLFRNFLPVGVTAFLLVLMDAYLTGGLHLDGLADSFDGLFSGREGDALLSVMRDSRLGAFGSLALWFLLTGKWLLLTQLMSQGWVLVTLLFPWVGRFVMLQIMGAYPYPPNTSGFGKLFQDMRGRHLGMLISLLLGLSASLFFVQGVFRGPAELSGFPQLLGMWFWPGSLVVMLGMTGLVVHCFVRTMVKKLGGATGDVYGASCEISQVVFLFLCVLIWGNL